MIIPEIANKLIPNMSLFNIISPCRAQSKIWPISQTTISVFLTENHWKLYHQDRYSWLAKDLPSLLVLFVDNSDRIALYTSVTCTVISHWQNMLDDFFFLSWLVEYRRTQYLVILEFSFTTLKFPKCGSYNSALMLKFSSCEL